MGFRGWVMSDWGATHSTAIGAGLDMEMPGGRGCPPQTVCPTGTPFMGPAKPDGSWLVTKKTAFPKSRFFCRSTRP